jgi:catechol 2,3-dioxygenase-like lactoylglutathione lyase family enzyme
MEGEMSSVDVSSESATGSPPVKAGEVRLEVVVVPVSDVDRAKRFYGRGVDVSEPFHDLTGIFHHAGTEGRVSGPAPQHADYGSFAAFSDPDGNGWLLQEIKTRLPGR